MQDQPFSQIGRDIVGNVARLIKIPCINTGDTIIINDLATVLAANFVKMSDMTTSVTFTISNNVLTLTTVNLTSVPLVGYVTGILAV